MRGGLEKGQRTSRAIGVADREGKSKRGRKGKEKKPKNGCDAQAKEGWGTEQERGVYAVKISRMTGR